MRVYYDLPMHSCLSPCGDDDMTPNNIVNMSILNELSVIALADHNTTGNLPAFLKVAAEHGITAFPAMELETAEEIHVLCLFRNLENAQAFDREVVTPALPPIDNRVDIFGHQQIMNEMDEVIGEEPRYLINATTISIDALPALIAPYEGLAFPAHIDKQTKSMFSVFGTFDRSMGYAAAELSKNAPADFFEQNPHLKDMFFLHDSDAHYLQDIFEANGDNFVELPDASADTFWKFLQKQAEL